MGKNIYRSNAKHKNPWQCGKKGSLCPSHKAMPDLCAQELLDLSIEFDNKRYATHRGMAFQAMCENKINNADDDKNSYWHGFPVSWVEVPDAIVMKWLKEKKISRKDIKKF